MESPNSPLSELSSDDFPDDTRASIRSSSADPFRDHDHEGDNPRPSKKPRFSGGNSWEAQLPAVEIDGDISSDTDGSVPGSPHMGGALDDEDGGPGGREQITQCRWDGCEAGDLQNMDLLVQHLHDEHIQARQKKYSCEWADCSRKGIAHASGYALRAHMRSHTREKPFYCSLPECDRSFTRSDALAKHMRTVHETEALRPSDPVPKHHSANPQNKVQRLRLTMKGLGKSNGIGPDGASNIDPDSAARSHPDSPYGPHDDSEYENNNVIFATRKGAASGTGYERIFPADLTFSPEELALPPRDLHRLLKRQLGWAQSNKQELQRELDLLDAERRREWISKELLLENLMEASFAKIEYKIMRKKERPKSMEEMEARFGMKWDAVESRKLPIEPTKALGAPWWMQHRTAQAPAPAPVVPPPTAVLPPQTLHRSTLDDLAAAAGV